VGRFAPPGRQRRRIPTPYDDAVADTTDATSGAQPPTSRPTRHRLDVGWLIVVTVAYVLATIAVANHAPDPVVDRATGVAANVVNGRLEAGLPPGTFDTVTVDGRTYQVITPLPILPYLVFAPFPATWEASRWIISTTIGIAAAWLMLPLARRYGPGGSATLWLAALGAFGTLLWTQSISGNFYYLAHVEAMLFTLVALIEWRGSRRAWVIALALGLAGLARPTVFLATIPFGVALLAVSRDRRRTTLGFALPLVAAVGAMGLYNALRFGSPLETGYGTAVLMNASLADAREKGVFSLRHVPNNLALLIARGFDIRERFPYLVPDPYGHSVLLTTPAFLAAVSAGIRTRETVMLWASAIIVAVPLLLYYGGGGYRTFGYRYVLDLAPFLLALVAIGAGRRFGTLEKLLILMSVAFVGYGALWAAVG
jgi:hypothetical protein